MASSTTGLTSELLANEIGTSDEADEASGSTKIGDGEIEGGERTYPALKRFSISKIESMMMDVDASQIPSPSVSSGKRKFSALRNDTSDISLLSSEPTATSDTSEHVGKSRSTGKGKRSAVSTSEHSGRKRSTGKISARKAVEVSNTAILHGMHGTMNRVSDVFEKSVAQPLDPQSAIRNEAFHFLQTREDNLSLDQKTKMVQRFMKDYIAAETYVALVNEDLRKNWLAIMLEE